MRTYKRYGSSDPALKTGLLFDEDAGAWIPIAPDNQAYVEALKLVAGGLAQILPGYTFQLSDFPTGAVDPEKLKAEVGASGISVPCSYAYVYGTTCEVFFDQPISEDDQTALAAIVAAHQGQVEITLGASSKVVEGLDVPITETDQWQTLGGVVTRPEFFDSNMGKLFGRAVGSVRAKGDGVELRILEQKEGAEDVQLSDIYKVQDSVNEWKPFGFSSNVPPRVTGPDSEGNTYLLQGRLNSAGAGGVRFASLTLMLLNKKPF